MTMDCAYYKRQTIATQTAWTQDCSILSLNFESNKKCANDNWATNTSELRFTISWRGLGDVVQFLTSLNHSQGNADSQIEKEFFYECHLLLLYTQGNLY